jgi:hypothetical protein
LDVLRVGGNGNPLDSAYRCTLHFDQNQLPPVTAFWSLTMYDPETYRVPNAINRYALGDRSELTYANDGSLRSTSRCERPDASMEPNWLAAPPRGSFKVALRVYSLKPEIADGT